MSRQLRRVPANWQHPQYWRESPSGGERAYWPMHQGYGAYRVRDWEQSLNDWHYARELWNIGVMETYLSIGLEDKDDNFARGLLPTFIVLERYIMVWQQERKKYGYSRHYHGDDEFKIRQGLFRFEDEYGTPPAPPNPNDYMPYGKWYQIYEEVSEGTPITPPFKTKTELVYWLATHPDYWGQTWTRAQAEAMVAEEWAPSMVMDNGRIMDSKEAVEDMHKSKEVAQPNDSTP